MSCTCLIRETRIDGLPATTVTPDPDCQDESHDQ